MTQESLSLYDFELAATRRPVLRLTADPAQAFPGAPADQPAASRIAGAPYLPAGADWPVGSCGHPMQHLAQLNLGELPALPGYPTRGILQFFICADDVFGLDCAVGSHVRLLPADAGPSIGHAPVWGDTLDGPHRDPDAATLLTGRLEETIISWSDRHFDVLVVDAAHPRAFLRRGSLFAEVHAARWGRVVVRSGGPAGPDRVDVHKADREGEAALIHGFIADFQRDGFVIDPRMDARLVPFEGSDGSGHHLGGYPFFTQQDPRSQDDPMVLLAQFDTDENLFIGDNGVMNFFIHPDDLARADFTRVRYNWDCH